MRDFASPVLAVVMTFVLATPVLAFVIGPSKFSLWGSQAAPAPDPVAAHNATAPLVKVAPAPAPEPKHHSGHHRGDD